MDLVVQGIAAKVRRFFRYRMNCLLNFCTLIGACRLAPVSSTSLLSTLPSNRDPFPPPAFPGFSGGTGLPPPRTARPGPRGLPVGAHAAPPSGASRVASLSRVHACRRNYPGGTAGCSYRSLPQRRRPSPKLRRVGFRMALFEACSAFTTRYGLHARRVTIMTLYTEGFGPFAISTTAPNATGWNDSCRVGISPIERTRLSRRRT